MFEAREKAGSMTSKTKDHYFERLRCSGTFVYTVDDGKPCHVRFTTQIVIQVKFDSQHACLSSDNADSIDSFGFYAGNYNDEIFDVKALAMQESKSNSIGCSGGMEDNMSIVAKDGQESLVSHVVIVSDQSNGIEPVEDNIEFEDSMRRTSKIAMNEESELMNDASETLNTVENNSLKKTASLKKDKQFSMKTKAKKHIGKRRKISSGNAVLNDNESIQERDELKNVLKQKKTGKLLTKKDIKCIYCEETFDTKFDFFNHRKKKGSSVVCKICGKEEPLKAHLMVHMMTHDAQHGLDGVVSKRENGHKRKRYRVNCNVCGIEVSSVDSLKVHMTLHTGESQYHCCVCENNFCSLSSLHHHQESHKSGNTIQCKECNLRFQSRKELAKHKFSHEIKCGLCGEIFPNKTSRSCHYRVSHPNDIKKCQECLGLFSTEEEFEKHKMYHIKFKKEQCPECGLVVTKLKEHMKIHTGDESTFACDQCPMKYKQRASLLKHLLIHSGEKPYACNKCPKTFRANGVLRKHLLTHTQERPFICGTCGKSFAFRSNLVTHVRIHSNEKKFQCPQCCQGFNYKSSLNIHLKCKHSNPLPATLSCVHCHSVFANGNELAAHTATHFSDSVGTKEDKQMELIEMHVPSDNTMSNHHIQTLLSQQGQISISPSPLLPLSHHRHRPTVPMYLEGPRMTQDLSVHGDGLDNLRLEQPITNMQNELPEQRPDYRQISCPDSLYIVSTLPSPLLPYSDTLQ